MNKYQLPFLAAIVAIIITTVMDFTGLIVFSAFPLIGITLIFWLINKLSKSEMGLKFGALKYYGLALLYPAIVIGICTLAAYLYGDFAFEKFPTFNISIGCTIGIIMVLITEEGFFRGWLWGTFAKQGMSQNKTLFVTSILFTIWHISAVVSGTDFGLPLQRVPVYLINATLLGLNWGLLRQISGSVIVSSVCHAIWNAFAYELFAFGEKVGALGVQNTLIFGPEVGFLGIILNTGFFIFLWNLSKRQKTVASH